MKKAIVFTLALVLAVGSLASVSTTAFAGVGLLQNTITYYTVNDGTNFLRSPTPFAAGAETQTDNADGSVTVALTAVSGYADSGFVIYDGTLGGLSSLTFSGSGSNYNLNLWFDINGDGEFFSWNSGGTLTGLSGDTYGLGPASVAGTLTLSGASGFFMMTAPYPTYTLSQLQAGAFSGITGATKVAVWIGVSGSGTQSATVSLGAAICSPTGFYRDGINLTAAIIDPSTAVTGDVDATGCNIGVYFSPGKSGSVSGADIHGANYFGVAVQQADVDVKDSDIHDIGESPLNGTQHGIAIYYATVDDGSSAVQPACVTGSTTGTISGNAVFNYQKGGIVANCTGTAVTVDNNTVTGEGPVAYIAQNGIQVSRGATAAVTGNTVTGNYYTQSGWNACGLLFYEAGGVKQSKNVFAGNQVNLCNAGRGGGQFNP